jgi:hypothetical protein
METIYKSGSGNWRQAEKSVQTSRSGLIRVEQEYKTLTSTVATDAATFAIGNVLNVASPALDSLYIYPEPQWREEAGGFSTISVSAYGRTRTGYTVEEQIKPGTGFQIDTTPGEPPTTAQTEVSLLKTYFVCRYVTATGEDSPITASELESRFKLYNTDGTDYPIFRSGYSQVLVPSFAFSESVNFGYWTEWTVVITFRPTWTD